MPGWQTLTEGWQPQGVTVNRRAFFQRIGAAAAGAAVATTVQQPAAQPAYRAPSDVVNPGDFLLVGDQFCLVQSVIFADGRWTAEVFTRRGLVTVPIWPSVKVPVRATTWRYLQGTT